MDAADLVIFNGIVYSVTWPQAYTSASAHLRSTAGVVAVGCDSEVKSVVGTHRPAGAHAAPGIAGRPRPSPSSGLEHTRCDLNAGRAEGPTLATIAWVNSKASNSLV